jgi:transcriptional regulator with XRE-family HTH domain
MQGWYYPRIDAPTQTMPNDRNNELGDFLRARRERLTPDAVGLPEGQRRRTPGLRRQELAELAGIGVDWYIRLEQGRAVSPSAATVDALARALRLNKSEHAHLRELARGADRRPFARETVPPTLQRIVEGLSSPAYITGRRWDVLAWNRAADDILGFERLAEEDRNILVLVLTKPAARKLFGDGWVEEAQRIVAQFRASHDLWAGDPAFEALLERLIAGSPEFRRWWKAHAVRGSAAGIKTLRHPKRGVLRFAHASFQANDDPALKLVIYTPA